MKDRIIVGFLSLVVSIAICPMKTASAQTPEAPQQSVFTPEQMADEAVRRYEAGDFNDAYNYIQKAKAVAPNLDKIKLIEGLLFLESRPRRVPEAIERLTAYNQSNDGKNDYRGNAAIGKIYRESRMYQLAIRPLERAKQLAPIEQDGKPLRAIITMDLAECHYGLNKKTEALTTAKEAESTAPNNPQIQRQLGDLARRLKDYETASRASDRAMGLLNAKTRSEPFKSDDLKSLQECVELKIKITEARLQEAPQNASIYHDIAVALREKAEVEHRIYLLRAREYGLRGIANDPKLYKLQVFVAGIEAELGGYQEALDRLNDTINSDPENQAAIKLRSDIQARAGAAGN